MSSPLRSQILERSSTFGHRQHRFNRCRHFQAHLPDFRKHVISFEVTDLGEEFDVWAQTTEVQSVQVLSGALFERKECLHQCVIVLLENLGHTFHFQMCLGIDRAEEGP
jgi:hypothetical protein